MILHLRRPLPTCSGGGDCSGAGHSVVTVGSTPPDGVPGGPAWDELAGQTTAGPAPGGGLLRASGDLVGEPRAVTHRSSSTGSGDRPLEIVTSRQWFIRLLAHRERLLEQGRALEWQPPYMRTRYEHWVAGLHSDWLFSRQRFFGVPVPLWYPLSEDGEVDHDQPIVPDAACRSTRPPTCPTATREPTGTGRAASPPTPTCSTPGPRPRSPPRSPGAGRRTGSGSPGSSPCTCAPRPTRSSGPGSSTRSSGPTSSTARCPGPGRPSPAG
jgi:hypothetical protein